MKLCHVLCFVTFVTIVKGTLISTYTAINKAFIKRVKAWKSKKQNDYLQNKDLKS